MKKYISIGLVLLLVGLGLVILSQRGAKLGDSLVSVLPTHYVNGINVGSSDQFAITATGALTTSGAITASGAFIQSGSLTVSGTSTLATTTVTNLTADNQSFTSATLGTFTAGILTATSTTALQGATTTISGILYTTATSTITGVTNISGAATLSGVNTFSGATTISGDATLSGVNIIGTGTTTITAFPFFVTQSTTTTQRIGTQVGGNNDALGTGCLVLGDSNGSTTIPVWIIATGDTITASTTKPGICK